MAKTLCKHCKAINLAEAPKCHNCGAVRLTEKINLGLSNRDGEIMIGKDVDGRCYLIAEADTYHNAEAFEGLGSTEHIEITVEAFLSLANVIGEARRDETMPRQ